MCNNTADHSASSTAACELALLYRAHAFCQPLEQVLSATRVPYRVLGGQGVFERGRIPAGPNQRGRPDSPRLPSRNQYATPSARSGAG